MVNIAATDRPTERVEDERQSSTRPANRTQIE